MNGGGWAKVPLQRRRLTLAMLAPWIALLLPLYIYLFGLRFRGTGDSTPAELLPISLFQGHGFDFRQFVHGDTPYWFRIVRGRVVSYYPVLPGLLNVPVYAVARLAHVDLERHRLLLSGVTASTISALSAFFVYLALSRVCRTRGAALAFALVYAFGTTVWSGASRAMLQHGPSVLFLSFALWALLRGGESVPWAGLALGLAVINRPTNLAIAVPLAVYVVRYERRRFLSFCVLSLVPALFQVWYATAYLESPLSSPQPVTSFDFGGHVGVGMAGLLFSPSRGLFVFSPFFLFALPAAVMTWRRSPPGPARLPRYLVVGIVFVLLLYSRWRMWWGGASFGYRLLTELAPLLIVLLALAYARIEKSRAATVLLALAVAVSLYIHFLGAIVGASGFNDDIDTQPERLWAMTNSELELATRKLIRTVAPRLRLPAKSVGWDAIPAPPPAWWRPALDDETIPGWVDGPLERASVEGPLTVSGWARSRDGDIDVRVAIWPDGLVPRLERNPRPDVAATLPYLGDCSRAGWRAVLPRSTADVPLHAMTIELRAPNGRVRRIGPIRFRWKD
jgi:hypothetical protein